MIDWTKAPDGTTHAFIGGHITWKNGVPSHIGGHITWKNGVPSHPRAWEKHAGPHVYVWDAANAKWFYRRRFSAYLLKTRCARGEQPKATPGAPAVKPEAIQAIQAIRAYEALLKDIEKASLCIEFAREAALHALDHLRSARQP